MAKLSASVPTGNSGFFETSNAKAVGLVNDAGFRLVVRGGMAGEQGLVPILYGSFENRPHGTRIHVTDTVPRIVGVGVYTFTLLPLLLAVLVIGSWFAAGRSFNGDGTFALTAIAFSVGSLGMVCGWMWLIGRDMRRPRFDILAEALDAELVEQESSPSSNEARYDVGTVGTQEP
jgi:hypothetical protein